MTTYARTGPNKHQGTCAFSTTASEEHKEQAGENPWSELGPALPADPPTGPGDLRLPHHLLPRRCGGTLVVHSHRALSISSHLACRVAKAASDRSSICKRAPLWTPLSARKSRLSGGRSVLEAAHRLPPPPHTRLFLVRTRIQCSLHLTPIGLEVSAVYVLF